MYLQYSKPEGIGEDDLSHSSHMRQKLPRDEIWQTAALRGKRFLVILSSETRSNLMSVRSTVLMYVQLVSIAHDSLVKKFSKDRNLQVRT